MDSIWLVKQGLQLLYDRCSHYSKALELKHIVETNLLRVSYYCIAYTFTYMSIIVTETTKLYSLSK